MIDLATARCAQPGCGGPISGVCINQIPFDECPNVIASDDAISEPLVVSDAAPDLIATGRTGELSLEEADAFLRSNGGIVIAIVAGPEAGKTTLAAAIYELLYRGRLEGFGFAGSETIKGFEERTFDSRVASEELKATTLRTPRAGPMIFLHLKLSVPDGRIVDLLLSDRSGEHFDRALDAPAQFGDFKEVERSDVLLKNHQIEIARLRKLVIALTQAGHLTGKIVHAVVTKADLLTGETDLPIVKQRAKIVVDELARRSPTAVVKLHVTGCRPIKGAAVFGNGIRPLLEALIPKTEVREFRTTYWNPGTGGTALDKLMFAQRWS
jgi:hypothetical protein